jgi:tryptophanase
MRILKRKQNLEKSEQLHIDLIASMQPTAMEMHKFSRIMTKDKAFEKESNYKVVTAIRTFKDKERLHYLLNNRLSGV